MKNKARVLVIHSDQALRAMLGEYFMARGNRVAVVSGLSPGIVVMKASRFDLVFMDFEGVEAARKLNRLDPEARIVVLTSDAGQEAEIENAGFEALQKPFGLPDVQEIVIKREQEVGYA